MYTITHSGRSDLESEVEARSNEPTALFAFPFRFFEAQTTRNLAGPNRKKETRENRAFLPFFFLFSSVSSAIFSFLLSLSSAEPTTEKLLLFFFRVTICYVQTRRTESRSLHTYVDRQNVKNRSSMRVKDPVGIFLFLFFFFFFFLFQFYRRL